MKVLPLPAVDLFARYQTKTPGFPLISCVLNGTQEGVIYWDGIHPNYFVVHKFGFADLIQNVESEAFEQCLYDFLLGEEFANAKIRWYDVPDRWVSLLGRANKANVSFVERAQLSYRAVNTPALQSVDNNIHLESITDSNYDVVNELFGLHLGERFWPSKNQFLTLSFGVVAYKHDMPAAICYACAIDENSAEIDVFTDPEFRGQGLGSVAVAAFTDMCNEKRIKPNWDCYTNNLGSMSLAKAAHFKPYNIYTHAIIGKSHDASL
jgi:GNAT superfamily N-acetyltransferase